MANDPYRAEGRDVLFRSIAGSRDPESEHVIARCDDEMCAAHLADALNLKAAYGRGEVGWLPRGD